MNVDELHQRFAIATSEEIIELLSDSLDYDEAGIEFAIGLLNHSELEVRARAYHILENIDSEKASSRSHSERIPFKLPPCLDGCKCPTVDFCFSSFWTKALLTLNRSATFLIEVFFCS
jgi:hypothetical protein